MPLELPEDYFDSWFRTPMVIVSPLHYPPQAARMRARSARVAGEERRRALDRRQAGPRHLVVNVGDMLARWTNDLFPPTLHRVINTSGSGRRVDPVLPRP
jgi:isopenicillin N synthase-like dioxygenase